MISAQRNPPHRGSSPAVKSTGTGKPGISTLVEHHVEPAAEMISAERNPLDRASSPVVKSMGTGKPGTTLLQHRVEMESDGGSDDEQGQLSKVQGLTAEIISPKDQRISWNAESRGSFDIVKTQEGGKPITTDQSSAFDLTDDRLVAGTAQNDDDRESEPHQKILHTDLLRLKQSFTDKLNSICGDQNFIRPNFKDTRSGDPDTTFLKKNFRIGDGRTLILIGGNFTGKTSCCYNFFKSLSEEKLGIYLDWNDYKDQTEKCDIETIIHGSAGLQHQDMRPALEWMKSNSGRIVFVVDNIDVRHDAIVQDIKYGFRDTPSRIIRSLLFGKRNIFPNSQVFCTTSQKNLAEAYTETCQVLEITGFHEGQMDEMGRNKSIAIPEHLKFLCINPGYCNVITNLLQTRDPAVGIESTAAVLVKLLQESLGKDKSNLFRSKMDETEQKFTNLKYRPLKSRLKTALKTSQPSSSTQLSHAPEESSESLDDLIMKSLYLGLFCSPKKYKELLKNNIDDSLSLGASAKMWVLSTALLRGDRATLENNIFEDLNRKLDFKQILQKRTSVMQLIEDKFQRICNEIQSRSQTTLDWLDIIAEMYYYKVEITITIRKHHGREEIRNVTDFLRKVRKQFHSFLKVEVGNAVGGEVKTRIKTSAAQNPNGQIKVNVASHDTRSTVSLPLHRSRNVMERLTRGMNFTGKRMVVGSVLFQRPKHGERTDRQSLSSFPVESAADYESLHGSEESMTKSHSLARTTKRSLKTVPESALSPWPAVFIRDTEEYFATFPSDYVKISNIFTISKPDAEMHNDLFHGPSSVPIYDVSSQIECELFQFTGKTWKHVKKVNIVRQIAVFTAEYHGIYVLAQAITDLALSSRYLLVCRTQIVNGQVLVKISKDDGVSSIATSVIATMEQRLMAKMNDQFNVLIRSSAGIVLSEWAFSMDSKFQTEEKSISISREHTKYPSSLICSISHGDDVVSQAVIYNAETSLNIEYTGKRESRGDLLYIAKPLSGGKRVVKWSSQNFVTLEGIDAGDQYFVYVCDERGTHIADVQVQTAKTIHNYGGTVMVGNCFLNFPKGAIADSTSIKIGYGDDNLSSLPEKSQLLAPMMDFRSSQKKFQKPVSCKVILPHIVLKERFEVTVMCFENNKWKEVSSTFITEKKEVEFECNHFSLYAFVYYIPPSIGRYLPFTWDVMNDLFYDNVGNFALGICLNHPDAIERYERRLKSTEYKKASNLIDNISLQPGVDVVTYSLKWGPGREVIKECEIAIDEEFWRNWNTMKSWYKKPPEGAKEVLVVLERIHGEHREEAENMVPYSNMRSGIENNFQVQGGIHIYQ